MLERYYGEYMKVKDIIIAIIACISFGCIPATWVNPWLAAYRREIDPLTSESLQNAKESNARMDSIMYRITHAQTEQEKAEAQNEYFIEIEQQRRIAAELHNRMYNVTEKYYPQANHYYDKYEIQK